MPTEKKSSCEETRNLTTTNKKLIYCYSTRLAFHMPGFYLLTIFNFFVVVPASRELPFTYS